MTMSENGKNGKRALSILKGAYPIWFERLGNQTAVAMLNTWNAVLARYTADEVESAIYALIPVWPEPPTLQQVLAQIRESRAQEHELDAYQAWDKVRRAAQNGIYESKKEFDRLPALVQKAVGSAAAIHQWALDSPASFERQFKSFERRYTALLKG